MNSFELLQESVEVLRTNKMRTGLAALGIIIGIGSVIALVTLGKASQQSTIDRISALGANMLTIRSSDNNSSLKYGDMVAILNDTRITTVDNAAAEYTANATVSYKRNSTSVSVSGVTPSFFSVRNIEVESGTEITQSNMELLNKVAVLGPSTSTELFGTNSNPIGQSIKINGTSFTVIGVAKAKGSSGRFNTDEAVYIPLTTAQRAVFGSTDITTLYVTAKNQDSTDFAENQVGYLLLEQHRISDPADADFSIFSSSDLLETVSSVTSTFTALLSGIAAISLIVGGIGIMNIMLVTVTERTREIGIKKALGAKRKTIIQQFLIEAIILTITGGIFGVITGLSVSLALTKYMDLPQVIAVEAIVLAVVVSCIIGVVFGWYPAQKASKLQPIEALRYE